ncbi:hypothetical protein CEXT_723031 [Caerostris extrusa]|uniref:Uncharacterized protein n=1 Tax=Caerostris extrusa TaxID=172846 RepID=A0AAV4VFS2_CAEEX|nr:hypothetical protein CEXT_723031 [Caerostris extrusa]
MSRSFHDQQPPPPPLPSRVVSIFTSANCWRHNNPRLLPPSRACSHCLGFQGIHHGIASPITAPGTQLNFALHRVWHKRGNQSAAVSNLVTSTGIGLRKLFPG